MNKSKINQKLDLGTSLIIIGLIIMMIAIPIEGLKMASIVSITMPGGAGASIDGIKPISATTLFVGFMTTCTGLFIKYKNRN
ncbi:MAG: hypothetical protein WA130_15535 [Candidatus Methanoperedens sp.]